MLILSVISSIFHKNRPDQAGGKVFCDADPQPPAYLLQLSRVHIAMDYALPAKGDIRAGEGQGRAGAVRLCAMLFLPPSPKFPPVLGQIAVFHTARLYVSLSFCIPFSSIFQIKVTNRQFPQEIHCPHAICNSMEHFQIDPLFIIADAEQIEMPAFGINITAWPTALLLHIRLISVFFKIVPKKAPFQLHLKAGKPGQNLF